MTIFYNAASGYEVFRLCALVVFLKNFFFCIVQSTEVSPCIHSKGNNIVKITIFGSVLVFSAIVVSS